MLAISGLAGLANGGQAGAPLVFAADTADPSNTLTITLNDTNQLNPGAVVATISDGNVTRDVWDFDGISFTGTFDTPGDVVNKVEIVSRYGFDLSSDSGSTSNFYAWRADADFSPGTLADVRVDMENVDILSLTSPLGRTTMEGLFEVPTVAQRLHVARFRLPRARASRLGPGASRHTTSPWKTITRARRPTSRCSGESSRRTI